MLSVVSGALLLLAIVDPWTQPAPEGIGRVFPSALVGNSLSLQVSGPSLVAQVDRDDSGRWLYPASSTEGADGARVAQEQVDNFLSTLRILSALRVESDGGGKRADVPEATFRIEGVGQSLELELGQRTTDGKSRWIRRRLEPKGEERFVLVEEYLVRELLASSQGWESHSLFHWNPEAVETIRVSEAGRTTLLSPRQVEWNADDDILSGQSDGALFLESVGLLRALRFEKASEGKCPANAPVFTISAGGETAEISDCGSCGDGQRLQTHGLDTCVEHETWQRIRWIVDKPELLVSTVLLPAAFWNESFQVDCGDRELKVDPALVDFASLRSWAKNFQAKVLELQEAQSFVPTCVLRGRNWELAIGKADGQDGHWVAQRAGDRAQFRLAPTVEPLVSAAVFEFRSLDLLSEDPVFATKIDVARGGKTVRLMRGEILESWTMADSTNHALATEIGVRLSRVLAGFRVESFGQEGELLAEKDSSTVVIEFQAPVLATRRRYKLRIHGAPPNCLVQLEEGPVGIPNAEVCQELHEAIAQLWQAR